jgi:hypothetical protein
MIAGNLPILAAAVINDKPINRIFEASILFGSMLGGVGEI